MGEFERELIQTRDEVEGLHNCREVSADEEMGQLKTFFKFVLSVRKAKHLDVTTMFTYSHVNTLLSQSERAYYLSYFIISYIQWNPVDTDTKGTCHGVRVIRMSLLSGLSKKKKRKKKKT